MSFQLQIPIFRLRYFSFKYRIIIELGNEKLAKIQLNHSLNNNTYLHVEWKITL